MGNFDYDPDLIRELAEELAPCLQPSPDARTRMVRAGIEAYAETYARDRMDEVEDYWGRFAGFPTHELSDTEAHRLLAFVALAHFTADLDWTGDEFGNRMFAVFEEDVADDPMSAIGREQ